MMRALRFQTTLAHGSCSGMVGAATGHNQPTWSRTVSRRPVVFSEKNMAHSNDPRRPRKDPRSVAEAVFKPSGSLPTPPAPNGSSLPQPREQVALRIDRGVLDHFQAGGPGWQDRINEALRKIVADA